MASAAEQLAANFNFGSIGKAKELKSRILFTLGALIVARIGSYRYEKLMKDGTLLPCQVTVYAMHVQQELDDWPEFAQRERRWLSLEEAGALIHEPQLQRLFREATCDMLKSTARPLQAAL